MKKQKLIFKVDNCKRGKVYVGGKWHDKVKVVDIHAEPSDYQVILEKYKLNENGQPYAKDNEIVTETLIYRIR